MTKQTEIAVVSNTKLDRQYKGKTKQRQQMPWHPPWLTAIYTVAKKWGAQNREPCHPNRPGHPACLTVMVGVLVVCCCGCRQAGHLVLLLAIVKSGYWRPTLPLWLRSMRFDDVVMDTKWPFKEVKCEPPAMSFFFSPNKLNSFRKQTNKSDENFDLSCSNQNKWWQFAAESLLRLFS